MKVDLSGFEQIKVSKFRLLQTKTNLCGLLSMVSSISVCVVHVYDVLCLCVVSLSYSAEAYCQYRQLQTSIVSGTMLVCGVLVHLLKFNKRLIRLQTNIKHYTYQPDTHKYSHKDANMW